MLHFTKGEINDHSQEFHQGHGCHGGRDIHRLQSARCRAGARAGERRRQASARDDQGQTHQDHRCARALPDCRGAGAAVRRRSEIDLPADQRLEAVRHRARRAAGRHGCTGRRHGSAEHQSVVVWQGARPSRADHQGAEREARRTVREAAGPARRVCIARLAVSGSRRAAARGSGLQIRAQGRGYRRQRGGHRLLRSEISSGVGESRRARRDAVHPPAKHAGTRQALQGQRLALQRDRQSARHHDRAAAPDLRRHAR